VSEDPLRPSLGRYWAWIAQTEPKLFQMKGGGGEKGFGGEKVEGGNRGPVRFKTGKKRLLVAAIREGGGGGCPGGQVGRAE